MAVGDHAGQLTATGTALDGRQDAGSRQAASWQTGTQAVTAAGAEPLGAAHIGQTALGLAVVIAVILVCAALLKRFGPYRRPAGRALKLVAGQSLGPRQRIVVVEIEDTWLVLGVAQSGISILHKLPAGHDAGTAGIADHAAGSRPFFVQSFAAALRRTQSSR